MSDEYEELNLDNLDVNERGEIVVVEPKTDGPTDPPKTIKGSASLIDDYRSCPAKAYARITRQPSEKSVSLILGTAVHDALERFVKYQDDPYASFDKALRFEAEKNKIALDNKDGSDAINNGTKCVGAGIGLLNHKGPSGKPLWQRMDPEYIEKFFVIERFGRKYSGKIDFIMFMNDGGYVIGDWKGLALDTPLPTPTGWTTMGEVQEGDTLFDQFGKVCKVVGKSQVKHLKCYRITFDDKTSIVCDHEHLWLTTSGYSDHTFETSVKSTELIKETLVNPVSDQRQHRVRNASPLQLPYADLPIDPYTLGAWIGDGKASDGSITFSDLEIVESIEQKGWKVGSAHNADRITNCEQRTVFGLRRQLVKLGLLRNKHIPEIYLRASYGQRLELLQGLMDTDGTYNTTRSQAVFTTVDRNLANQVYELIVSLGNRCGFFPVTKHGFGLTVQAFDLAFTPISGNPFTISRKRDLVKEASTVSKRRLIVSVDEVETVPTQCIAVDSIDHTYLCGHQMVPTHNTGKNAPTPEKLAADIQFSMYAYATKNDPQLKTFGKLMHHGTYVHLRGQSEERHESGKRKAVKDTKDKTKISYDFKVTRTEEQVESHFRTKIEPVMQAMEAGIWYRNEGTFANPCSYCSYYNKDKKRCEAEIPADGFGRYAAKPNTVDKIVDPSAPAMLFGPEVIEESRKAGLKPYNEPIA